MFSSKPSQCPCDPAKLYQACCGRFIEAGGNPKTPEELMRSRYSAFTMANMGYIMATMKSPAADGFNASHNENWARTNTWLGLEVKPGSSVVGNTGYVEFIARFKRDDVLDTIEEKSEFHQDANGKWFYVSGEGPRMRNRIVK